MVLEDANDGMVNDGFERLVKIDGILSILQPSFTAKKDIAEQAMQ